MMIMKKGVAVDTLILIILGVIVIALVAYLIFTHFGIGKNVIESKECLAARIDYCMTGSSYADLQKNCPGSTYADVNPPTNEAPSTDRSSPCEGIPGK